MQEKKLRGVGGIRYISKGDRPRETGRDGSGNSKITCTRGGEKYVQVVCAGR